MNRMGLSLGRSYGYVDLGTDLSTSTGEQLAAVEKVVRGGLSSKECDVISEAELLPEHYYLKITLDVKNPTVNLRTKQLSVILPDYYFADIDLTSRELPPSPWSSMDMFLLNNATYSAISNVQPISFVRMDSRGRLQSVNAKSVQWSGRIQLDGAIPTAAKYSLIQYSLPQLHSWNLTAVNVALGSSFKNLHSGDMVTSAPGVMLMRNGGSCVRYMANENTYSTDTQEFSYKFKGRYQGIDLAAAAVDENGNMGIFGLDSPGQEMTVVSSYSDENSQHSFGRTTDTYKVVTEPGSGTVLQRIRIASDGLRTVAPCMDFSGQDRAMLNLHRLHFGDAVPGQSYVDSNFTWTKDGNGTGYFAVKQNKADIKAAHTIIKGPKAYGDFIAVALDGDGSVKSIRQMQFQHITGTIFETKTKFSGQLAFSLGGKRLSLNRQAVLSASSINAAGTTLSISGAGEGSSLEQLQNGDMVSTASLQPGGWICVDGQFYVAAAKTQLGFKKQGNISTAVKGTFILAETDINHLWVYDGAKPVDIQAISGEMTVTVTSGKNGAATYTISNLQNDARFSVGSKTYQANGAALFCYEQDKLVGVCAMGSRNSVTSAVLAAAEKNLYLGTQGADNITGASHGADYIQSGAGDDTIKLGGATDYVRFNLAADGHNVVKGYGIKDKILLDDGEDFTVELDTTGANVYLRKNEGSIALMGMGQGQAVSINGSIYHFGNGTLGRNKTQTTAGTAFNYQEGAHYYGNDSGKNKLNISKAASQNTADSRLTVNLTVKDAAGMRYYHNVDTVNAAASAKGVDFTAGDRASCFIGSAYDDTITCGDGRDYITCQAGKGNDTITNFGIDDVLQLNGLTQASIAAIEAYNGSGSLTLTAKAGRAASTITLNDIKANKLTYNAKTKTITGA